MSCVIDGEKGSALRPETAAFPACARLAPSPDDHCSYGKQANHIANHLNAPASVRVVVGSATPRAYWKGRLACAPTPQSYGVSNSTPAVTQNGSTAMVPSLFSMAQRFPCACWINSLYYSHVQFSHPNIIRIFIQHKFTHEKVRVRTQWLYPILPPKKRPSRGVATAEQYVSPPSLYRRYRKRKLLLATVRMITGVARHYQIGFCVNNWFR